MLNMSCSESDPQRTPRVALSAAQASRDELKTQLSGLPRSANPFNAQPAYAATSQCKSTSSQKIYLTCRRPKVPIDGTKVPTGTHLLVEIAANNMRHETPLAEERSGYKRPRHIAGKERDHEYWIKFTTPRFARSLPATL